MRVLCIIVKTLQVSLRLAYLQLCILQNIRRRCGSRWINRLRKQRDPKSDLALIVNVVESILFLVPRIQLSGKDDSYWVTQVYWHCDSKGYNHQLCSFLVSTSKSRSPTLKPHLYIMCNPKVRLFQALAALPLMLGVHGWGSSNSASDNSIYAESFKRDWLYDATAISMKLEGCVWGYVADEEEAGCLASSSQDGTYYWYQMANCRRAQAAFSLYTTESSSSVGCNSNTYKETVSSFIISRFFFNE